MYVRESDVAFNCDIATVEWHLVREYHCVMKTPLRLRYTYQQRLCASYTEKCLPTYTSYFTSSITKHIVNKINKNKIIRTKKLHNTRWSLITGGQAAVLLHILLKSI